MSSITGMSNNTVKVVGRDSVSAVAAYLEGDEVLMYYRLTNCCGATGKGSDDGYGGPAVVCRSCYQIVSDDFGMAWTSASDLERWTGIKA